MNKQPITFEMLPKAIEHLFEELAEIKSELKRIKGSDAPKRTTMKVEEAAQFLGKAVSTLRTLSQKGNVPSYKVGKHRVFIKEELEAWIMSRPTHLPSYSDAAESVVASSESATAKNRLLRSTRGRKPTKLNI